MRCTTGDHVTYTTCEDDSPFLTLEIGEVRHYRSVREGVKEITNADNKLLPNLSTEESVISFRARSTDQTRPIWMARVGLKAAHTLVKTTLATCFYAQVQPIHEHQTISNNANDRPLLLTRFAI